MKEKKNNYSVYYHYNPKNDKYYITCPGIAKCQSIIIPDKYNQSLYEYLYNIDLETRDWI